MSSPSGTIRIDMQENVTTKTKQITTAMGGMEAKSKSAMTSMQTGAAQTTAAVDKQTTAVTRSTGAIDKSSASMQRSTKASIGTVTSIAALGSSFVLLEAGLSRYDKALFKVQKSETAVKSQRDLVLNQTNLVQKGEIALEKARASGNKTAAEMAVLEQDLQYKKDKLATDTEKLTNAQEKLRIANMDYNDTLKTMAVSMSTTVLTAGTSVTMMLSDMAGNANMTTGAFVKQKLAVIANSGALKALGFDLKGAKTHFTGAAAAARGMSFSLPGLKSGLTGVKLGIRGVITAMGPLGLAMTAIGILWAAWDQNLFGLREAVHDFIDILQTAWQTLEKLFPPLRLLGEGLKSVGIDIGFSIDQWQEQDRAMIQANDTMEETTRHVTELSEEERLAAEEAAHLAQEASTMANTLDDQTTPALVSAGNAAVATNEKWTGLAGTTSNYITALPGMWNELENVEAKQLELNTALEQAAQHFTTAEEKGVAALGNLQNTHGSLVTSWIEDHASMGGAMDASIEKLWVLAGNSEESFAKLAGHATDAADAIDGIPTVAADAGTALTDMGTTGSTGISQIQQQANKLVGEIKNVVDAAQELKKSSNFIMTGEFSAAVNSALGEMRELLRLKHEADAATFQQKQQDWYNSQEYIRQQTGKNTERHEERIAAHFHIMDMQSKGKGALENMIEALTEVGESMATAIGDAGDLKSKMPKVQYLEHKATGRRIADPLAVYDKVKKWFAEVTALYEMYVTPEQHQRIIRHLTRKPIGHKWTPKSSGAYKTRMRIAEFLKTLNPQGMTPLPPMPTPAPTPAPTSTPSEVMPMPAITPPAAHAPPTDQQLADQKRQQDEQELWMLISQYHESPSLMTASRVADQYVKLGDWALHDHWTNIAEEHANEDFRNQQVAAGNVQLSDDAIIMEAVAT